MEKNVTVIYEEGKIIGVTYPKRAKGLIKKGRARLVDENTVCLACPPNENLEDIEMENTTENKTVEEEVTLKYVLDKLDEVREAFLKSETEQISLLKEPEDIDTDNMDSEDIADVYQSVYQSYYSRINDIKMSSQTSLQQMIAVYSKCIDKIKPKATAMSAEDRKEFAELVNNWAKNAGPGVLIPDFEKLASVMYGIKAE